MLSAEKLKEIYDMIEQGMSCRDIAKKTGISPDLVRYYGNKIGADMNRLGKNNSISATEARKDKIRKLLLSGVSQRKTMQIAKCSMWLVLKVKKAAQSI